MVAVCSVDHGRLTVQHEGTGELLAPFLELIGVDGDSEVAGVHAAIVTGNEHLADRSDCSSGRPPTASKAGRKRGSSLNQGLVPCGKM